MLAKKMIRDIWNNKTQFISIFLMAFIGVFVFVGISAETAGLEANSAEFYEETNFADGWIYSPYLNDLFLNQTWYLGATTEMERQLVVDSVADFDNEPEIKLHFVENNTISKYYPVEGEPLDINDSDGVWLDKYFADAKGLKVGDNISFDAEGYHIEKQIRGIGYSPEYIYHTPSYSSRVDFSKMGFAYLSHKAFPEDNITYNVLNVKFDGKSSTYQKLLDYRLEGYYGTFLDRSTHPSYNHFSQEITQHKMIADILPLVFILITVLILATTMSRIIAHQRTQIGTLKALGFKNKTITLHYISYGFFLVLAGSILGLILGPMIVPQLFLESMTEIYALPSWDPALTFNFVVVVALMVISSVAVSYYTVRSISNEKPSMAIKPKPPKTSTSGFFERSRIWKRLSFNFRWNYRDAKRNKLRGLMTIMGVMGCCAILIGAFGMYDGVSQAKSWEYGQINHYDSELIIGENASDIQIEEAARQVNGQKLMEESIEIASGDIEKSGFLQVLNKTDLITPTDKNKDRIEIAPDEVSISQKLANLLEVGIGDSIRFHIMGSNQWVNATIDKIHADPTFQGVIMSPEKLEDLGLNYTATSIITSKHVNESYDGIKTSVSIDEILDNWDESTESMWLLIYILIFFACILAVVVLYNLGLLSFTEIEREIATLKVLGFKSRDLRRLLLTQNLIFTSIGYILGVPIGFYILCAMWQVSGDNLYNSPSLTLINVLLTAVITFSLSIIVNLMFSGKIKNLDMVESLKGQE